MVVDLSVLFDSEVTREIDESVKSRNHQIIQHTVCCILSKYLKDIKIDLLLKIFPSFDGKQDVQLHGKKRKLKRQEMVRDPNEHILDME